MSDDERLTAQRTIPAPAPDIFRVITDPRGHVAIDGTGMLMSAEEPKPVEKVGDTFLIHMDREALGDFPMGKYDVVNTITKYEPDALLEWAISGVVMPPIGHVYGYQLEPAPDGATLVTSYYDWSAITDDFRKLDIFPVIPASALRVTLGILERVVLAGGI